MKTTFTGLLALGTLTATGAYAANGSGCDAQLSASLEQAQHIVGSLHPDKPSQMRVYAIDGSEFTAGQSQWMKGRCGRSPGPARRATLRAPGPPGAKYRNCSASTTARPDDASTTSSARRREAARVADGLSRSSHHRMSQ